MCQAKADGGKRCASAQARAKIKRMATDSHMSTEILKRFDEAVEKYGHTVTPMNIPLPRTIEETFTVLRQVGNPLLVGGTIRDAIMGIEPKDFDIEVHGASMETISQALKGNGYRVDAVGQAFGVLKVKANGEEMDISIPRRDSLIGAGHRGFTIETDPDMGVVEASARRDYTINAIMYDPHLQVMIDPHGGHADIKALTLRHVSEAFADDPLRPLRGVQFAARYNMTIHPDTAELSSRLRDRYSELPKERIRDEWMKFYHKGEHPSAGLRALKESGWADTITGFNAIDHEALDNAVHTPLHVKAAVMTRNMDDQSARAFLKETIVGDTNVRTAYALSRAQAPSDASAYNIRQWSRELSSKGLTIGHWAQREIAHYQPVEEPLRQALLCKVTHTAPVDILNGDDIISAFPEHKPSRWVSSLVVKSRQAQDAEVYSTREEALAWLKAQRPTL